MKPDRTTRKLTSWPLGIAPVLVAAALLMPATLGCGPALRAGVDVAEADTDTEAKQPPLPEEALLRLDELSPAVEPPRNPEELPEPHGQAAENVEQAEQRLREQDLDGAVRLLESAAGMDPEHPGIRRSLGIAYLRQQKWAKAKENFRKAAEVAPDDLMLQVWLGMLAVEQNRYDEAIVDFRRAMKCSEAEPSEPLAAEALLRLAQLLHHEEYYTASLECYEQFSEWVNEYGDGYVTRRLLQPVVLRPERLLVSRGELLLELRRPEEAAELLDRAFRLDRSRPQAASLLLRSLLESDRSEQAFDTLMNIAADPAHREQFAELAGMVCDHVGDPELPGRIWQRYRREVEVDGALAVKLADMARQMGADDEAADLLSDVLETMPGNVEATLEMVRIKFADEDVPGATGLLVNLLTADISATDAVREAVDSIPADKLDEAMARRLAEQAAEETQDRLHAAHYLAGIVAERANKDRLAAEQYRAAVDAAPAFPGAIDALADVYIHQRRLDRAEALLDELGQVDADYFKEYLRGKVALASGRTHEALTSLRNAHEMNTTHLPTIVLLSRAYRTAGLHAQSAGMLRRAIPLSPTDVELYRRLFDIHAARDEYTEAREVVEQVRSRTGDELAADVMTAELHLALREYDKGRQMLDELLEKAPEDQRVQLLEARTKVETVDELDEQQFTRAVDVLSRAIVEGDGDDMALRMLMQLLDQRRDEAVEVLRRLYDQTRQPRIAALYVDALTETGEDDDAIDVLKKVLETDPESIWARHTTLHLLRGTGRITEALQYARDWLAEADDEADRELMRRQLLMLYSEAEDYDSAQEVIDDWLNETRDASVRRALRAEKLHLLGRAGEYDKAVDFVAEALDTALDGVTLKMSLLHILDDGRQYETAQGLIDEWLKDADEDQVDLLRYWRINLHANAGRIDQAVEAADRWIEQSPGEIPPRAVIVRAMIRADRLDKATELLEEWRAEHELEPEAEPPSPAEDLLRWYKLTAARLLLLRGSHAEALERLDAYESAHGEDVELLVLKASSLEHLGRTDEAIEALERANTLDPADPTVNNNLGYMYADLGIELDKAERLVRRALDDVPDEIAFLDSLAWVFYKQGRFGTAAEVFERTLEVAERRQREGDPDARLHSVILDHAGDNYWRLGRTDEAVEMWRRAVETAEQETPQSPDDKKVIEATPEKIEAAEAGEEPRVAPLGESVAEEEEPDNDPQQ